MSKAEKTKQHIIEKASTIFNTKGVAGTSVDDVLRSARVARGCLYGHFESREDLVYATVDYLLNTLSEKRDEFMEKQKTAGDKILAYMEMNKNPLVPFIDGGCPIVNLSPENDDTNPVIRKKLKKNIDSYLDLFTAVLTEGIAKGELSKDMNPEEFSTRMFCAIEGANMICRVKNSIKPMQSVLKGLRSELNNYLTETVPY